MTTPTPPRRNFSSLVGFPRSGASGAWSCARSGLGEEEGKTLGNMGIRRQAI